MSYSLPSFRPVCQNESLSDFLQVGQTIVLSGFSGSGLGGFVAFIADPFDHAFIHAEERDSVAALLRAGVDPAGEDSVAQVVTGQIGHAGPDGRSDSADQGENILQRIRRGVVTDQILQKFLFRIGRSGGGGKRRGGKAEDGHDRQHKSKQFFHNGILSEWLLERRTARKKAAASPYIV